MRFLFCPLEGPGFIAPAIAVARALAARGHAITFLSAAGSESMLAAAGLSALPARERRISPFAVASWAVPEAIVAQALNTRIAAINWRPDVIVTSQLTLGPLLAREQLEIPVAVIGLAAYLWPLGGEVPAVDACGDDEVRWRGADMWRIYNQARRSCGLGPIGGARFERFPLQGDLFLVQSVPELEPDVAALPSAVRCVGSLAWDPPRDPEVDAWLTARGSRSALPIVYAQPGRAFGGSDFFEPLLAALAVRDVDLVADIGRRELAVEQSPPGSLCKGRLPVHQVMPHAAAAIGNGHTTTVLAALAHGVPLVLFPNGSGTDDIAARCAAAQAAVTVPPRNVTPRTVGEALDRALHDPILRRGADRLREALARTDGPARACDALVALGSASASRCPTPTASP
jgi:UDP:flavonoid glycosyltransferase YjiC (YdhE family)